MTPAVCRLLFVCFFCTLWGGQVIADEVAEKDAEGVRVAVDLQNDVRVWQRWVEDNATNLLSLLQQAEQKIGEGEKAVKEMEKEDAKTATQKVLDDIKKEITAATGSATTAKTGAYKFLKDIETADSQTGGSVKFQELLNKKEMGELKKAAGKAAQVWDPIHKEAPTQTKNAGEASASADQAKSTAEKDPKFPEREDDDKEKLKNVKTAVDDAKTALVTAAKYASDMAKAAKEVQKKLGEMLQAYRNAAGPAGGLHEEGAKNEDGKNEKGGTGAGKENGAADGTATKNETDESTLRQTGEKKSSSVDRSSLTTLFFPTLLVSLLFGPVAAAITAA